MASITQKKILKLLITSSVLAKISNETKTYENPKNEKFPWVRKMKKEIELTKS
jgi:hypothetical protein